MTHQEFMKIYQNPPKIIRWSDDIDKWQEWFLTECLLEVGGTKEDIELIIPALCSHSMKEVEK